MKKTTRTLQVYIANDGTEFEDEKSCRDYEEHLKWYEESKLKYGDDFEFSALKNDKFNYFYHSKLGIIKNICDRDDGIYTLPELDDEFLDEIVAQIVFANEDRSRVPQIYNKICEIVKQNKKKKKVDISMLPF